MNTTPTLLDTTALVILPGFADLFAAMLALPAADLIALLRDPDLDPVQLPVAHV